MATTYKAFSTGTEPFTARVFADGVEIYDTSRLDNCTFYEWFHDPLTAAGLPDPANTVSVQGGPRDNEATRLRIGDAGNVYNVPLNDVANSGEYYCEIYIGDPLIGATMNVCDQTSERRRISIIQCLDQTNRLLGPDAVSAIEVRIVASHYEEPNVVFSNEDTPWITRNLLQPDVLACPALTPRVCTFIEFIDVAAQDGANQARTGQVSLTIGDFTCFYNIAQDYRQTLAGQGEEPEPELGPFIILTQDGPTLEGGVITVTATTGIIGGTLDPTDAIVEWSASADTGGFLPNQLVDPDDGDSLTNVWNNKYTGGTIVSATIRSRSDAFPSASAQIDISFAPGEPVPTRAEVSGASSGVVNCWTSTGQDEGFRVRNGRFRITGGDFFEVVISHEPNGALGPSSTAGGVITGGRFQLRGPGVADAVVIEPRNIVQDEGGVNGAALGVVGFQIVGITGTPGDFSARINGQTRVSGPVSQVFRITGNGNYSWGLQSGRALGPVRPEFRNCLDTGTDFIGFPADGSQQRTSFSIRT